MTLAVLIGLGVQLARNLARAQREYPVSLDTAFGRIDFPNRNEPGFVETTERLMAGREPRELFAYPFYASLYLMTDTKNPTPYQFLFPDYSGPKQVEEVIGILERRKVPVVFAFSAFLPKDDALIAYLRQRYDAADEHKIFWTRRPG
jgi:hypothetical protein